MAIVGHWDNVTEAQKLVQHDLLLAGVVEEIIEYGQLLPKLPVFGIDAKNITYRREKTLPSAKFYDIQEQLDWTTGVDYDTVDLSLKRVAAQRVLDHFMAKNYRNPNDFRAIMLSECSKGCLRTIEDKLIYGNSSTDPQEFDGMRQLVDANMRIDEGGALSLANLRQVLDEVRPEASFILMPFELQRRMDAAMWEAGISGSSIVRVQGSENSLGKRLTYFDGTPIIPTDFLVKEDASGNKDSTGTAYSVYVVRTGQLMEGGLAMAVGAETGKPNMFRVVELDNLEDYDAAGIRLVAYMALGLGSTKSLAQIYNVSDAAVVA